jgi:hypothetical protein
MGRIQARGSTTDLHNRGRPTAGANSGRSSASNSQSRARPVSQSSLRGMAGKTLPGSTYLEEPSPWTAPPTMAQMGSYGNSNTAGGSPRPTSLNGRAVFGRRQTAMS